ncbi:hypothetical protein ACFV10_15415 [Streptomyces cyaneofuscatus]|uniref:hypothetical protein n=1 Tax=Streptomyces cyaneofuscatus TaxID=66883 RepID=UPI0036C4CD63
MAATGAGGEAGAEGIHTQPAHLRVHDAPSRVTIDVTAVGKASGMAAYRIAEFTP